MQQAIYADDYQLSCQRQTAALATPARRSSRYRGHGRDHTPDVPDTGRDQSRIRKLCNTQRNVDPLLHEADLPVEKKVAELDCEEFRQKGVDDGPQDPGAEKHSTGISLSCSPLLPGSLVREQDRRGRDVADLAVADRSALHHASALTGDGKHRNTD